MLQGYMLIGFCMMNMFGISRNFFDAPKWNEHSLLLSCQLLVSAVEFGFMISFSIYATYLVWIATDTNLSEDDNSILVGTSYKRLGVTLKTMSRFSVLKLV